MQFSLQKLQMLTPVHNDEDNANNADAANDANNADNFNRVIGIALLKAFNCANKYISYLNKLHWCIFNQICTTWIIFPTIEI